MRAEGIVSLLAVAHFALVACLAMFVASAPIAFDNLMMSDTLFLANLGWRGVNGLQPVIDYPHFYGGGTAGFMTAAFALFGPSYKSIYFGYLLAFTFVAVALAVFSWKRLRLIDFSLLLLLVAALTLSFTPIENPDELIVSTVSHAYFYNHLALAIMCALAVHALVICPDLRIEIAASVVAGIALCLLAFLKTTFAVFAGAMLFAYLVQGRWKSATIVLLTGLGLSVVLDPGWVRLTGSLDLLLQAAGGGGTDLKNRLGLLVMAARSNVFALLVVGAVMGVALFRTRGSGFTFYLAMAALAGGYLAALISMAGLANLKLLPLLAVCIVLLAASLRLSGPVPNDAWTQQPTLRLIGHCLVYAIAGPALVVGASAWWNAIRHSDDSFVRSGPLAGYVVAGAREGDEDLATLVRALDQAAEADDLPLSEAAQYVILSDGVALLRQIPEVERFGIVADSVSFEFTVPLLSRPVASMPAWPSEPVIAALAWPDIPDDVDIVMISDLPEEWSSSRDFLTQKMGDEFRACRRSPFWTLWLRTSIDPATFECAAVDSKAGQGSPSGNARASQTEGV